MRQLFCRQAPIGDQVDVQEFLRDRLSGWSADRQPTVESIWTIRMVQRLNGKSVAGVENGMQGLQKYASESIGIHRSSLMLQSEIHVFQAGTGAHILRAAGQAHGQRCVQLPTRGAGGLLKPIL